MSTKSRLDIALVERGYFESREQAQRAIMAGKVRVNEQPANKASIAVTVESRLEVEPAREFVGRGGQKLAGALDHFAVDPKGKVALDIGASTGGFTDCLLQRGAVHVHAVDVGHSQMAWKIRSDPRVNVLEKTNARYLTRAEIPAPIDLCVIDVSFISLTLILPPAVELLVAGGVMIALIKPQFELQAEDVGRGGIVRDPLLHERAMAKITDFCDQDARLERVGVVPSPITGTEGNQEFFICLRKR